MARAFGYPQRIRMVIPSDPGDNHRRVMAAAPAPVVYDMTCDLCRTGHVQGTPAKGWATTGRNNDHCKCPGCNAVKTQAWKAPAQISSAILHSAFFHIGSSIQSYSVVLYCILS